MEIIPADNMPREKRAAALKARLDKEFKVIDAEKPTRNIWDPKKTAVGVRDYFVQKIKHNKIALEARKKKQRLTQCTPSQSLWAQSSNTPNTAFKNIIKAVLYNKEHIPDREFPWSTEEFTDFCIRYKQNKVLRPVKRKLSLCDLENVDPNCPTGEFKFGRKRVLLAVTNEALDLQKLPTPQKGHFFVCLIEQMRI